jgi:hypothetical protein
MVHGCNHEHAGIDYLDLHIKECPQCGSIQVGRESIWLDCYGCQIAVTYHQLGMSSANSRRISPDDSDGCSHGRSRVFP